MSDPGTTGGTEVVTVTGPAHSCLDILPIIGTGNDAHWGTPTLLQSIEYNLCMGWTTLKDAAVSATHWIWDHLKSLWNELWNIGSSVGSGIVNAGKWVGHTVASAAGKLWDATKSAVQWIGDNLHRIANNLYDQFGALGNWILLAGALLVLYEVSPAINDLASNARRAPARRRRKRKK